MQADNERILNGGEPLPASSSRNYECNTPENLTQWLDANRERAKGWETMPYFIKDNPTYAMGFVVNVYSQMERKFTRAGRTKEAKKEALGDFMQSVFPNIPNTEKAAIFFYTQGYGATFRSLNKQCRNGNLSEFNKTFSELLSDGLSKLPKYEGTVYRTIRLNKTNLKDFIAKAENRGEMVFEGFTSTSKKMSVVNDFLSNKRQPKRNETDVILVIKGKTGRSIEELSQYGGRFEGKPDQFEILFDKGLKSRFDGYKIENERMIFYLSET